MINIKIFRNFTLFIICIFFIGCAGQIEQSREYLYLPNTSTNINNAIVVAKVIDQRPDEIKYDENKDKGFIMEMSNFFEKTANKMNSAVTKVISGKKRVDAAQIILLSTDNNKEYYLGDKYIVSLNSKHRRLKVGNKGDLQVYDGMPAYSVISIPHGEYLIIGAVFYKNESGSFNLTKPKYFNSNEHKKFSIHPEEAVYIGDINVYGYHIDIDNKFNEAQEYVDISYPRLAHILKKGTIQKTTNEK